MQCDTDNSSGMKWQHPVWKNMQVTKGKSLLVISN